MAVGDDKWASVMQDALFPEPEVSAPRPNVQELEEQFADGFSYAPDGCRVDFPEELCEHGQLSWAAVLASQDEGDDG